MQGTILGSFTEKRDSQKFGCRFCPGSGRGSQQRAAAASPAPAREPRATSPSLLRRQRDLPAAIESMTSRPAVTRHGRHGDAMPAPLKVPASAGAGMLLLTEAKMAAAVSELLTGWCLFGLALLVSGGCPRHTHLPLSGAGSTLAFPSPCPGRFSSFLGPSQLARPPRWAHAPFSLPQQLLLVSRRWWWWWCRRRAHWGPELRLSGCPALLPGRSALLVCLLPCLLCVRAAAVVAQAVVSEGAKCVW